MGPFSDMEDVEEWLASMDYETFWRETAPFGLALPCRDNCDTLIRSGKMDEAGILDAAKGLARLELIERHRLPVRDTMRWHSLH